MRVLCVGGARPNFVKLAPLHRALAARPRIHPTFVHTGQHYDHALSAVFLEQLGLPPPTFELQVGSGGHADQTAAVLTRFEPVLAAVQPHVVVVVGDVNSTIACALGASKFVLDRPFASALGLRRRPLLAHVEAGLRSGDPDMPEEINRRATDAIADLLFTTEASADDHLRREGVPADRVHLVGNLMIDSLYALKDAALARPPVADLPAGGYLVVTLHRPGNVDEPERLGALLEAVAAGVGATPVVFPVHPRTRARLEAGHRVPAGWHVTGPLPYLDFVALMARAGAVATDSGGIQEETAALGVPCVTLRDSTERPVTLTHGRNRLAGTEPTAVAAAIHAALTAPPPPAPSPPLWDGQAAPRIASVLEAVIPPTGDPA